MRAFILALAALAGVARAQNPCNLFGECGTLVQGATCVLFETPGGQRYVLETTGGAQLGDFVLVGGFLDTSCATLCQEGDGCIVENTVQLCVTTTPILTSFCHGDGTDAACPCGNSGAFGHGCASSANPAGALLSTFGSTGGDSLVLVGSGMPAGSGAIYLKGDVASAPVPFGDGLLCAGGALVRLRFRANVGGCSHFPEPGEPSLSVRGGTPVGSGATAVYQVYYRNAAAFCTSATFNTTNAQLYVW